MQHTLKPYLINAFYAWCMDIGFTPLLSIHKWSKNSLPEHLQNDDSIIFNIHPQSIRNLVFGKDTIEFEAMFKGKTFQLVLDYKSISTVYTREDEYGLDFEVEPESDTQSQAKRAVHLTLVKNDE